MRRSMQVSRVETPRIGIWSFLRHWKLVIGHLFLLLTLAIPAHAASPDALILYDSNSPSPWIGPLHGKMLANLLGHFPLSSKLEPVEQYRAGQIANHRVAFYFGTAFNNQLPRTFLQDALSATSTICWFKYNLWQVSSAAAYSNQFRIKFGFRFDYMADAAQRVVRYKGEEFFKDPAEIELGHTTILKPRKAHAVAMAGIAGGVDSFP